MKKDNYTPTASALASIRRSIASVGKLDQFGAISGIEHTITDADAAREVAHTVRSVPSVISALSESQLTMLDCGLGAGESHETWGETADRLRRAGSDADAAIYDAMEEQWFEVTS